MIGFLSGRKVYMAPLFCTAGCVGFTCMSVEHGTRVKGQKLIALERRHRVADGKSVFELGGNAELFQESLC